MIKCIFNFVGTLIPFNFNKSVNAFSILWKSYQRSTKHEQDLHQMVQQYKLKY